MIARLSLPKKAARCYSTALLTTLSDALNRAALYLGSKHSQDSSMFAFALVAFIPYYFIYFMAPTKNVALHMCAAKGKKDKM